MASSAASILANSVHFFSEDPIPTSTHSLKSERESDPATVATTPYPVNYTPSIGCNKKTTLKSRVASGETLYGLFLMSASPTIAEIAGLSGYDFVVVDMEHGPGGISDALSCIRALAATGTAAIIRVSEKSAAWTKKALDLGPQGIMFPMVENGSMAEQVVSYCRYPPRGIRGTAHVMVRASGYGTDDTYVHRCEEELLVLCWLRLRLESTTLRLSLQLMVLTASRWVLETSAPAWDTSRTLVTQRRGRCSWRRRREWLPCKSQVEGRSSGASPPSNTSLRN